MPAPDRFYRREDGKIVAEGVGKQLRAKRDPSQHFLQKPPGIAFDRVVIDEACKDERDLIVVTCPDGTTYTVSMQLFLEKMFPVNRGFGNQVALVLGRWEKHAAGESAQTRLF